MNQELWLGRFDDVMDGDYGIFAGKPTTYSLKNHTYRLTAEGFNSGAHGLIDHFCPEVFHALATARLRKGRCRKIKRILIELED